MTDASGAAWALVFSLLLLLLVGWSSVAAVDPVNPATSCHLEMVLTCRVAFFTV